MHLFCCDFGERHLKVQAVSVIPIRDSRLSELHNHRFSRHYVLIMSKRFKSSIPGPAFPRTLGAAGAARIAKGEPWLRVWSQQLATPLTIIERRSKIDMRRLIEIEMTERPTDDELAAIADALRTEVGLILESRHVQSLSEHT